AQLIGNHPIVLPSDLRVLHRLPDLPRGELRIEEEIAHAVDRGGVHACALQELHQRGGIRLTRALGDELIELALVLPPGRGAAESFVVGPFRLAERTAKARPFPVIPAAERAPPSVAAGIAAV